VSCRTIFTFKDGSVDDETTVFSQRHTFRLISYHHIQKGPSFPHPMDLADRYPERPGDREDSKKGRQGGSSRPAHEACRPTWPMGWSRS